MDSTPHRTARPFRTAAYSELDSLTSFEYSKTFQRRDHLLPELNLMFAVLTNAIECLQKNAGAKSRRCLKIFRETEAWIFSGKNHGLYTFEYVCEALQLDPSYLRKGLMPWRGAQPDRGDAPQRRIREPLRYGRRLRDTRISV